MKIRKYYRDRVAKNSSGMAQAHYEMYRLGKWPKTWKVEGKNFTLDCEIFVLGNGYYMIEERNAPIMYAIKNILNKIIL